MGSIDISVLFSTRNRARQLRDTLSHMERLELNGLSLEVIAIDNGSSDDTRSVMEDSAKSLPLIALQEPEPGKNRALNRGLEVARGDLLVFTDDDVQPDAEWLLEFHGASRRWPDDGIFGGRIEPLVPPDAPDWIRSPDFDFAMIAYGKYAPSQEEGPTDASPHGGNMAIRASALGDMRYSEVIGPKGRNFAMGSETELLSRLRARGERCLYVPSARVNHVIESEQTTLEWLFGRVHRMGRGWARLNPQNGCAQLWGAPRYLWKQLAAAWIRHRASCCRSDSARFETGREYHKLRGIIHEYRLMSGG